MPKLICRGNAGLILLFALLVALVSCENNKQIPFPSNELEFSQPAERPFKFGKSIPIQWEIVDSKPVVEQPFEIQNFPSSRFDPGQPAPLSKTFASKFLDWAKVPDTVFSFNFLPTEKLKLKTTRLGAPKIVQVGLPVHLPGTSRGVMHVGTTQGLPGNGMCFAEDHAGLLWMGTTNGLCRYDGKRAEIYSREQGLSDLNITAIYFDRQGRIWIGTLSSKIFIIDRLAGVIHEVMDSFKAYQVFSFMEDRSGRMWVIRGDGGATIVNESDQTVKHFDRKHGLAHDRINLVTEDAQGRIWLPTFDQVTVLDLKVGKNWRLSTETGLNDNCNNAVVEKDNGEVWICGCSGINILKNDTIHSMSVSNYKYPQRNFTLGLLFDKLGRAYVGTGAGVVLIFDFNSRTLDTLKLTPGTGDYVFPVFKSKHGRIWMAAAGVGALMIDMDMGRPINLNGAQGLGGHSVWGTLEASDGKIWLGSHNGLDVYDPLKAKIQHIMQAPEINQTSVLTIIEDDQHRIWTGGRSGLKIIDLNTHSTKSFDLGEGINAMTQDKHGNTWLGSGTAKIYRLDIGAKYFQRISNLPLPDRYVSAMATDNLGRIWIGFYDDGGVIVIDPKGESMSYVTTEQGLSSNYINEILVGSDGSISIGSDAGLDMLDKDEKAITSFTAEQGLASDVVYSLNENNGTFYVGTSAGLSLLTTHRNDDGSKLWRSTSLDKRHGLDYIDFNANSSMITKHGQFWAGVEDKNLTVLDEIKIDTITPTTYISGVSILDKTPLFLDKEYTSAAVSNIDTLWSADQKSSVVSKEEFISTINQDFKDISWDSLDSDFRMPQGLVLPYDNNYLSFAFSTSRYENPDKLRYRYMLEGVDKKWGPIIEDARTENYRDLPPGHYTLKVVSKGINHIWSKPTALSFTIAPPWWKSFWAYLAYALVFVSTVRAYIVYRSRALKVQNLELEEKVANRTEQLQQSLNDLRSTQAQLIQSEKMASLGELTAGVAHEIQNPLNFVNNFSDLSKELLDEMKFELGNGNPTDAKLLADNVSENLDKIIHHGKRADAIVKGMLQHSRTSSGKKEPTDLNALCDEYLRLAYHGLRAKDKSFNATMNTNFDASMGKINVIPQEIGRVVLNLLTNAFYAVNEKSFAMKESAQAPTSTANVYQPTVSISTKRVKDLVEISVSDNGGGIPKHVVEKIFQPFFTTKPTGSGTGLGLSLSYDIVKSHGGKIEVNTDDGKGTEFIVSLPGK